MAAGLNFDEDILREVVKLGFTRDYMVDCLKRREQNKVGGPAGGLAWSSSPQRRSIKRHSLLSPLKN